MGVSLGCAEEKVLGGVGVGGVSLGCAEEKVLGGVGVGGVSLGCAEGGCVVGTGPQRSINGNSLGWIEGMEVDDVVLDTGCTWTMVQRSLVPEEKLVPGATIRLRCAHGDVVTYPLADLKLEVDGVVITVRAAVAERLPVSMLLGTEVAELGQLLSHHTTSQCW